VLRADQLPAGVLERAGLPPADAAAWAASAPTSQGSFDAEASVVSEFLTGGIELLGRLPDPPRRTDDERAAAAAIGDVLTAARESFLRARAADLYDALTDGLRLSLRIDQLLSDAAARVPGLTPTPAQLDADRERRLADKQGVELAQGVFLAAVLAVPRAGRHLLHAMLRPTSEALDRLPEFRATGVAELGAARVTRRGRAGILELSNPRHLNAEDGLTLAPTEIAVDLILLDPAIEVGVFRGAVVDQTRYAGQRVFDRAARQAIFSGREWTAGEPDADLLCDEVVDPGALDQALADRIEALTSSGLINAAANRRVLRVGQEPLDLYREYMSSYAREQAYCHLSPALVRNLEQHWNAHRRNL
jgi:hypothetical protein